MVTNKYILFIGSAIIALLNLLTTLHWQDVLSAQSVFWVNVILATLTTAAHALLPAPDASVIKLKGFLFTHKGKMF